MSIRCPRPCTTGLDHFASLKVKEGKLVAKIIKKEAKVEKVALEQAVRELAELQRTQKYAVKVWNHHSSCLRDSWLLTYALQEEARASAAYGQALRTFHKEELAFLAAKARFERAQADVQVSSNGKRSFQ